MPSLRNWVLGAAFVVTLAASLFDLPGSDPLSADKTPGAALPASAAARPAAVTPPARGHYAANKPTLFAARSWQAAPTAAPKASAPRAPALPFRYLGKVLDGADITVFVDENSRTHLLHKGDVLANYRVEEITPAEMTFVYLPLNEKQRLIFGSAN
jgi:hypothetical protein